MPLGEQGLFFELILQDSLDFEQPQLIDLLTRLTQKVGLAWPDVSKEVFDAYPDTKTPSPYALRLFLCPW